MGAPIKECNYCKNTGKMPTFIDGETMCYTCLSRLPTDSKECRQRIVQLESKVDSLMLEYCPEEMTPEQLERFEESQAQEGKY